MPAPDDPALDRALDRLELPLVATDAPPPVPVPVDGPEPPPADLRSQAKRAAKRAARPFAQPVLDRINHLIELRAQVTERRLNDRFDEIRSQLRAEVADMRIELDAAYELLRAEVRGRDEILGADVAALRAALEAFGTAIAPSAGLPGVADRFAELRSRVNALDRRIEQAGPAPTAPSAPAAAPASTDTSAAPATPEASPHPPFDYVGFERRFRGERSEITDEFEARYLDLLEGAGLVLDVGCGRGELLGALATHGIEGVGVDLDAGMVAEAQAAGIAAHHGDALAFLRAQAPDTYGAITAIQVIEHLQFDQLLELVDLAVSRLKPGGLFIAETPNPATLFVLGNSYILDPTHVWPLHPSLTTFVCERAGFASVDVRYAAPAIELHVPLLTEGDVPDERVPVLNAGISRLNHILFGPQDYAVIARKPATPASP